MTAVAIADDPVDVLAAREGFDPTHYQHERYLDSGAASPALRAYYAVKPLVPRSWQLAMRRRYASRQGRRAFPAWPIEPLLADAARETAGRVLEARGVDRIPIVGFWPAPHSAACVLTHDVEGPAGIERIPEVLEIERRHGMRSAWNFVAEDYPIPADTFAMLREAGCEVGLHAITHDGKLFGSRRRFAFELPQIHAYLACWDVVGFRAPATRRNAAWMHELGCGWDSSFPDTDPYEPQPGGCCSILPFFFGDVVELPLTLAQDHTLWEVLGETTNEIWRRKAAWLVAEHGLVNVNVHPDYLTTPERLDRYAELVADLAAAPGCWQALPRDVAAWWRQRAGGDAPVWWATRTRDRIEIAP